MIDVPIYSTTGQEVGKFAVDETLLGTTLRPALLKQALVMYHANLRQGTVATRSRAEVWGSTKKLYAQKHTGNARRGNLRTNVMKGGGNAFAKKPREFRQDMPLKQRRLARNNAILAKILSNNLKVVENFAVTTPKTKLVAGVLKALQADRSVLIAIEGNDAQLVMATRNLAKTAIKPAVEVSAWDVLTKRTMIITKTALEGVLKAAKPAKKAKATVK